MDWFGVTADSAAELLLFDLNLVECVEKLIHAISVFITAVCRAFGCRERVDSLAARPIRVLLLLQKARGCLQLRRAQVCDKHPLGANDSLGPLESRHDYATTDADAEILHPN
ncbi:hypothetical protein PI125_g8749 [Phytophthora idaei]|nr:hypothetical protein PI125_g8749 [Phytophthora idaei]